MTERNIGQMSGEERRKKIIEYISESKKPVSGSRLAEMLKVSRQVIVQDIALLRAEGREIFSTNRGYVLQKSDAAAQVFYVYHTDDRIREELNLIVDNGGKVLDVFVQHEVYGELRADLNVDSRKKVKDFLRDIESGKSNPLNTITSGYHYHTVIADSREELEQIGQELAAAGFLADRESTGTGKLSEQE